jgi:TPR repeat protein
MRGGEDEPDGNSTQEISMPMLWMNSCKSSVRNAGGPRGLTWKLALILIVGTSTSKIGQAQLAPAPTSALASVPAQPSNQVAMDEDIQASYQKGMAHLFGSAADLDYVRAAQDFRRPAARGLAEAELVLRYLYERGLGVQRDDRLAVSYYKAAAEQGNVLAANNLGAMYEWGHGVSMNLSEAVRWYRFAAEHGNYTAQANLAGLYFFGKGLHRDYAQAAYWLRKAAEQGSAIAQVALAYMYSAGKGVPLDYLEAAQWARRAADQGDPKGEADLASFYEQGKGVPLDYVSAYRWYSLSLRAGNKQVKHQFESLSRIMTARQINEATGMEARSVVQPNRLNTQEWWCPQQPSEC